MAYNPAVRTLADLVAEDGPLEVRDAIGWTLRAAMTLWALHEEGVLHGRVSPAAILVEDVECRSDGILVRPSQLDDAPAYYSMDRAEGAPPSKQDDVWAIGITLYFVLTGELPYPKGVIAAAQTGKIRPPPPIAVHGGALDVMQPVIDRLIRADRRDRLKAAREIVAGLRDLSPAIADLEPLAIERPFDETDIIGAPSSSAPEEATTATRNREARRTLANGDKTPPARDAPPDQARWMLFALAGALAVVVAFFFVSSSPPVTADTADTPAPTGDGSAQDVEPAATPTAASPVSATASSPAPVAPVPLASSGGVAEKAPPADAEKSDDFVACTAAFFAPDAFEAERVAVDFPCQEENPAEGIQKITTLLARGSGGQASKATVEWSNLGWYRVAAFAVIRGRCCSRAPTLSSPPIIAVCELDAVLEQLSKAVSSGRDDAVAVALQRFGVAASCVGTAGGGPMFGMEGMPRSQQAAVWLRMVARLRAATRK